MKTIAGKQRLTAIAVPFNRRQMHLLENLDDLFGETVPDRVNFIVVQWLSMYEHVYDDDDE